MIHRWFNNGEGWAYHSDLITQKQSEKSLAINIIDFLSKLPGSENFQFGKLRNFSKNFNDGTLCVVREDEDPAKCLFELAKKRLPFIYMAAYFPGKLLKEEEKEKAYERLRMLAIPDKEGQNNQLLVDIAKPVEIIPGTITIETLKLKSEAKSEPISPIFKGTTIDNSVKGKSLPLSEGGINIFMLLRMQPGPNTTPEAATNFINENLPTAPFIAKTDEDIVVLSIPYPAKKAVQVLENLLCQNGLDTGLGKKLVGCAKLFDDMLEGKKEKRGK